MSDEKKKATIVVPSEDPSKKDKSIDEKKQEDHEKQMDLVEKKDDDAKEKEDEKEMSEEDQKLQEALNLYVKTILETPEGKEQEVQRNALEGLRQAIRSSTSSMTSVPKPLKFMKSHWEPLQKYYTTMAQTPNKELLADILSCLSMTMHTEKKRLCLKYKLEAPKEAISAWGHEYVRTLAGEIGHEYAERIQKDKNVDELLKLVDEIIPFNIAHNAEVEAVDLLTDVEKLEKLKDFVNKDNHARICEYLLACSAYQGDIEDMEKMLNVCYDIYLGQSQFTEALRVAVKLDQKEKIINCFKGVKDRSTANQMGFILGESRFVLTQEELTEAKGEEDDDSKDPWNVEEVAECLGNVKLNPYFTELARELEVADPKLPDEIYKQHLVDGRKASRQAGARPPAATGPTVDSAKQNLASTFVNAFVNAGFGKDKLLTPERADWLYKNKGHGMLACAASLGMILLWDVESGFSSVDKYSFSSQNQIKAGALLASGIVSSGVTSDMDAAHALLSEQCASTDVQTKICAVFGLGLSYAGTARDDVLEFVLPLIVDATQTMEVASIACLSLGLVYVGTAHEEISSSIVMAFMDRSETELKDSTVRLMCLGLGLLFLGVGEKISAAMKAIAAIEHPIQKYLAITIETCAYAGTGNVLAIQRMLAKLTDHIQDDEKNPLAGIHQEVAVLGVSMIAMGDKLSEKMALRSLDHVLQYGEVNVRRAIPLALSLLSISHPRIMIVDTLSKLSHDQDLQVSQNAVLSLGFLGAGTNNSRIANILRELSGYYSKEPNHLFLVRIAQGLLHLGKGLMTLSPFHSDNFLMSKVSMAGLLALMHSSLDLKHSFLASRPYLLFSIVCAMRPRMLITVDADFKSVNVAVRVGQAVDVVGQAGKPKKITGFQTHKTPVLLAHGERAELATDEYIAHSSVLEGIVIVKKNPLAKKDS